MQKVRIFIKVRAHDREKEKIFESILYKDIELPSLPTERLKVSFDDLEVLPPIESVVWNASGNYHVCKCADEIVAGEIGREKKHKFFSSYVNEKYKDKGWINLDIEDEY